MEFYDKESIKRHFAYRRGEDVPDLAIVVRYPDGATFLYLIKESVKTPYYTFPASYAIFTYKENI